MITTWLSKALSDCCLSGSSALIEVVFNVLGSDISTAGETDSLPSDESESQPSE